MPSDKKHFGCRPDEETWQRAARLKIRIAAALKLEKISDSILLRLALLSLETHEFPDTAQTPSDALPIAGAEVEPERSPAPTGKGRGAGRKGGEGKGAVKK